MSPLTEGAGEPGAGGLPAPELRTAEWIGASSDVGCVPETVGANVPCDRGGASLPGRSPLWPLTPEEQVRLIEQAPPARPIFTQEYEIRDEGPGEEDGPWAEGWPERSTATGGRILDGRSPLNEWLRSLNPIDPRAILEQTTLLPGGDFQEVSADEYIRVAREEVIPLVLSGPGRALGQALIGDTAAGRRLGIMLGALHAHRGSSKEIQDLVMVLGDGFGRPMFVDDVVEPLPWDFSAMYGKAWDPAECAAPEFPELPQKGRSPKKYHHQFHPPADRSGNSPSEAARAAARKKRKKK